MNYDGLTKYDASVAANYDRDRQGEDHWKAENDFIEGYALANPLGQVLDVPVGTGRLFGSLKKAQHIVGFDVSLAMLAEARKAASALGMEQIELLQGDALSMPFSDDEFDTIFCFRLLHLLPPPLVPQLLQELGRVCRRTILLQAYVYPERAHSRLHQLLRRLGGPLLRRLRRGSRPWSHIESFSHSNVLIEAAIRTAGLRIARRHELATYGGSAVVVLELAR